jgi:hypothetical protein
MLVNQPRRLPIGTAAYPLSTSGLHRQVSPLTLPADSAIHLRPWGVTVHHSEPCMLQEARATHLLTGEIALAQH